jgi:hypothetical protein
MKPADAYEALDHTDVLQINARHRQPCTDDVVLSVFHRTTGSRRSVLLPRQQATGLNNWLSRWIEEGWDGVPRRCPAAHTPGDRWLFECDQPPGPSGPHEGLAARWPPARSANACAGRDQHA